MQPSVARGRLAQAATIALLCVGCGPSGPVAGRVASPPAPPPAPAADPGTAALPAEPRFGAARLEPGLRIVSLAPSVTEMLYALGGQPALVGRSQHCNWPAAVAAVPSVGSGLQPDLEAVLALQPSLVVATELQATAVEPIRARGTRVVLLPHGRVADIGPAMVALSQSIGLPERGATWSQWLRQLTSRRPEPSIRALLVVARDPFYAAGPDGFGGELLGLAGARDVLTGGDWVRLDEEALLATAPDLLIESRGTVPDLAFWAARPSIPAVAAGRVCGVDEDPISRPGPRVAVALAQLRACVEGPR